MESDRAAEYARLRAAQESVTSRLLTHPVRLAYGMSEAYAPRPHLRVIGDALAELVPGSGGRLLITTPPQIGKSSLAGEWFPFWWLCQRPRDKIVTASYASSLAAKRGGAVRALIAEHGREFGLRLNPGSRAKDDWMLTSGGGMRSVGVGGGLTGFPADVAIVDDPHKDRAEAESLRQRDLVWDWWSSVLMTRLAPGAPAVLILTRWHVDDLAGRVLASEGTVEQGGRWRVVHLPALATQPDDPLGRPIGGPLSHPKLPTRATEALRAHWEDKRATATIRDWAALYQGDPQPSEGALLSEEILRARRCYGPDVEWQITAVAVDPSGGGRDTAGIVAGSLADDGRLYLRRDDTAVMSSEAWSRRAARTAFELEADRVVVEVNYGGDMATLVIRTAWDALQREGVIPADALPPRIVAVRAKKGKVLRAEPIAQQWVEDRVRTAAWMPELEGEWSSWQPGAESPGRIDASAYLGYALLPIPGAGAVVSTAAAVSREEAAAQGAQGGWAGLPIRGHRIPPGSG
ncbi:MAG: terminase family protein [Nocardiopsaceae bacterium]|nr:terminase family protein [Nocardiopsaceae bacterium]